LLLATGLALGSVSRSVDIVFELFLTIYEPFIVLILKSGNYRGDAAMIDPVIKGVPLGVVMYGLLTGGLGFAIGRRAK